MNKGYAHSIRDEEGERAAEEFLTDVDRLLEDGILLVGCCAHARRKLHTCYEAVYKSLPDSQGATTCNTLLGLIGELYGIERSLRPRYESGSVDENTFIQQRKEQAFPVLAHITDYAEERIPIHEQEPSLYKALKYLLNQIDLIGNYLVCSELTPDNNFQEQQFRDLAIARRNSMFASSIEGAQAWAKLFTLLRTAMLNTCDPTLYLKYVLDKLTILMNSEQKAKDIDWSQFRPWNIDPEDLQAAWDS
jgi:transposase